MLQRTLLLSILVLFAGCFPQAKNPMLVSDVSSFYLDDTTRQARKAGVAYRPALDAAFNGDPKGLRILFKLTSSGVLHDRGADSHAAMLWTLLNQWGDQRFSKVLAAQPEPTRRAVVTYLDYAAPGDYAKNYPLTYRLGPHNIPYGGG